jgi:hypothetical protein
MRLRRLMPQSRPRIWASEQSVNCRTWFEATYEYMTVTYIASALAGKFCTDSPESRLSPTSCTVLNYCLVAQGVVGGRKW